MAYHRGNRWDQSQGHGPFGLQSQRFHSHCGSEFGGRWHGRYPSYVTPQDEQELLEDQKDFLETQLQRIQKALDRIKKRIQDLPSKSD